MTCSGNTTRCTGENIRLFRLLDGHRPTEWHLCQDCRAVLEATPFCFTLAPVIERIPAWRQTGVAKDLTGHIA